MLWNELENQACSVARTVSVIGDRWTLLILRECFRNVRRFDDFQECLGISRAILANRLKKLEDSFVLTKVAYRTSPVRHEYQLTQKGLDLYPILMAIAHWGDVHMADKKGRALLFRHSGCGHVFDPKMVCSECGEVLYPQHVHTEPGPSAPRKSREPRSTRQRPDPTKGKAPLSVPILKKRTSV